MRPTLNKSTSSQFLWDQAEGKIPGNGMFEIASQPYHNPLTYSLRKYCMQEKQQTTNFL